MGNMKLLYVVATWIWWTAVVEAAVEELNCSGTEPLRYNLARFTTIDATKKSYNDFLEKVRDYLSTGHSHGIRVMRDPSTVQASERFLLVELTNWDGLSVTLAIDVTDGFVRAYQASDRSFFLSDAPYPEANDLFTGTARIQLPFDGSYISLQRTAEENRDQIDLGIGPLSHAIANMGNWEEGTSQNLIANGLIICIQMVSEAARITYFQRTLAARGINGVLRPDYAVLSFENNWGHLSRAIQNSQDGVFAGEHATIQLERPTGTSTFEVDRVTPALIANLALLLFSCNNQASRFPGVIRSVVDDGSEICETSEPTIHISGRNGLCVDVRDGDFHNGNPVQLWPCRSNTDANQLWTLKEDRTIRSNGKCLTAYGFAPGEYVMIYECDEAVPEATYWKLLDDGSITITDPGTQTALALSANEGDSGTTLTVQKHIYASSQGWQASNNTEPFVTSIVGFKDLCLQANGDEAWLGECDRDKIEQQWAIYADGSIRPQQNRDECLACKDDDSESLILIQSCDGSSKTRWNFRNDNTIKNLYNGLVMDVRASDLSLRQIIIYPITGNPNQKWFMTL